MNHPKRVLIVDDEPNVRLVFKTVLELAGYTTLVAETGEDALRQLAEGPVDLILLDLRMPGLDGIGSAPGASRPREQHPDGDHHRARERSRRRGRHEAGRDRLRFQTAHARGPSSPGGRGPWEAGRPPDPFDSRRDRSGDREGSVRRQPPPGQKGAQRSAVRRGRRVSSPGDRARAGGLPKLTTCKGSCTRFATSTTLRMRRTRPRSRRMPTTSPPARTCSATTNRSRSAGARSRSTRAILDQTNLAEMIP